MSSKELWTETLRLMATVSFQVKVGVGKSPCFPLISFVATWHRPYLEHRASDAVLTVHISSWDEWVASAFHTGVSINRLTLLYTVYILIWQEGRLFNSTVGKKKRKHRCTLWKWNAKACLSHISPEKVQTRNKVILWSQTRFKGALSGKDKVNVLDAIASEITAVSVSPSKCCALITVMATQHNMFSDVGNQAAAGGGWRSRKGWFSDVSERWVWEHVKILFKVP